MALAGLSALSIASLSAPLIASAEETQYSNVLTDLSVDSTFSVDDYPLIADNYSINVIQVAESVDNELFVYAYQPSASLKHKATAINMSVGEDLDPLIYDLTYINNSDTLFKYKVDNLTCSEEELRVYDITSIFRAFDENIDKGSGSDNIITSVSYAVGKIWSAQDYEGETLYSCLDTEVITITDKYVGFVRYDGGYNFWGTSWACDSHFVAFSSDREIDKLIDAEVYYSYNPSSWQQNGEQLTVNCNDGTKIVDDQVDEDDIYKYFTSNDCKPFTTTSPLKGEAEGSYESGNFHYKWDRIQTVEDFIQSEHIENTYSAGLFVVNQSIDLTDEALGELQGKKWVLRFFESDYIFHPGWYGGSYDFTAVYNVSLLKLKFETDGKVFNLGVVDNMQSGTITPSNRTEYKYSLPWWAWVLIAFACVLLLFPLIPSVITFIFKTLYNAIKYLIKGLWWLFTTPLSLFE